MARMTGKGSEVSSREGKGNRDDPGTDWAPSLQQGSREQRPGPPPPCRELARDSPRKLLQTSVLFYKCDLLIKRFLFFGNTAVPGATTFPL